MAKVSIKDAVVKTGSESLGIVFLTAGVNAVLAGNIALGVFLIVLGIACLFGEKFVGEQ
jgi:hypothetical protein